MDEKALLQLVRDGDREALRLLFEENKKKIFCLAYQYTKNAEDAEDILQETFIKAYRFLDKFDFEKEASFSPWLYRIGINCSIDYLRRNRMNREKKLEMESLENVSSNDAASDPEQLRREKELKEKIDRLLNKLSGRQRMVFILRHYQQLSTKEIADYMNSTEGSVKKQLFRAVTFLKQRLKRLIGEKDYEMQKI
jgi:RNA polymerase sigma-70 factor (ECF subfamily)